MEITDIRIKKLDKEKEDSKLKAYASVTFDDSFVIHNIKVIEGNNGLFIAMPSRKTRSNEMKDIAHPINSSFREKLQNAIIEAYQSQ